jgi:hypothetical protein
MTKAKEKVGHALRFSISSKDSGEERTIRDIIAADSSSEQPATKKRKLQNEHVSTWCDEAPSADFSMIRSLIGTESSLPDLSKSSCEQFDYERSSETMIDEDTVDLLLNDPTIFHVDPIEDYNDAAIDDDLLAAMESLVDPDGAINCSMLCW